MLVYAIQDVIKLSKEDDDKVIDELADKLADDPHFDQICSHLEKIVHKC